jgi:hypothetical protein
MSVDPRFGPAQNEEAKRKVVRVESKDEVEHSNLNCFLIFGVLLPYAWFTIGVDALVNPVDNNKPNGFLLEVTEQLECLDDELVELTLQCHFYDARFRFDYSVNVGSEFGDGFSELIGESDNETGGGVALWGGPPEEEGRTDGIVEIKAHHVEFLLDCPSDCGLAVPQGSVYPQYLLFSILVEVPAYNPTHNDVTSSWAA